MRHLVIGASGAQGGAVARRLVADGRFVRGFTRTGGVPGGVEAFPGDLGDAGSVREAFAGMTHASVTLPMVYEPGLVARQIGNVIEAARAAGIRRLVYNTGTRLPETDTGVAGFDTRRAAVEALLASGLPVVVVRPTIYLDNLLAPWVTGPLRATGELCFPLPAGLPVAWLSHGDLAEFTVTALTRDGLEGRVLDAGGPEAATGHELAAAFGPEVRYAEQDVDAFEAGLARALGAATAAGVAGTYRWIAANDPVKLYGPGPSLDLHPASPRTWIAARRRETG